MAEKPIPKPHLPLPENMAPAPAEGEGGEAAPFWRRKRLEQMSVQEWESLCDGCGRCCLVKLEDEDTGKIHFTDVACKLLETHSCRCSNYPNRQKHVPDCIKLKAADVMKWTWLPPTCAYRLIAEGKDLAWWHPLVSGSPETVHDAGVSVRDRVSAMEDEIDWDNLPDFIVRWPGEVPPRAARPAPAPGRASVEPIAGPPRRSRPRGSS